MSGDVLWLDVLPSMSGFAQQLSAGAGKASAAAGVTSGRAWAQSFSGAATTGGTANIVRELETASTKTKKVVTEQVQAISRARAAEQEASAKVLLAEQALADARSKHGADSAKTEAASLRLSAARTRQESAATRLVGVEDQLIAAQREHRTVTEQLARATSDLDAEAQTQPGMWGQLRTSLAGARGEFSEATGGLGGLAAGLAAATGGAMLFGEAWSQSMDLNSGVALVTASLDLTATESAKAGAVAGNLYADNFGESITEVTDATGTVMSSIEGMRTASQAELEKVTGSALTFAKVFDVDVAESSRNAGILIKTGLAKDATGAFDLMTASLQQVPKALRGEVVDATQEYSQYFAQLGLSGEQSMGMLVAASAGGQYAIDKTGDALKELTIRATDMSKASVGAYELAGLSAEDMSAKFLAGGPAAAGALSELVAGLQNIPDPTTKANAAIALFGTPLEDIGTDKIPEFLDGLAGMNSGLGDVRGSAADMATALAEGKDPLESLKRELMGSVNDGLKPFIGPATTFLKWAQDTPGVMTGLTVGLGFLAAAFVGVSVATWAMNSALLANPITWIVLGIVAAVGLLVGLVVLIVKNWEPIGQFFSDLWQGVLDAAAPVVSWFQDTLLPIFASVWEGVQAAAGFAWAVLQVIFVSIAAGFSLLGQGLMLVWDTLLKPVFDLVWLGAQVMWNYIDQYVFQPLAAGWALVGAGFAWVKDNVLTPAWTALQVLFQLGWNWLDQNVFQPLAAGWAIIGAGFAWVKDEVIDPAWAGLQLLFQIGWNWIDEKVFSPMKAGVEAIGTVFEATKTVIEVAWEKIKAAAAGPVNFVIETVYTKGIKKTWDSIAEKVGLDLKLPVVKPIALATGGVLPGYTPGVDVHSFFSPTGGRLDLSGGEAVMRPEWTRAVGGPAAVERMNRAARRGEAFANGGVWGNISGWAGDTWDTVASGASAAWDWTKDAAVATANFLRDPIAGMTSLITKPMNALLERIGGGEIGTVVAQMPTRAVSGLVETVKGLVTDKVSAAASPGGAGVGIAAMTQLVRALLPGVRITSGYRPGARTAGFGNASMHAMGRALDLGAGGGHSLSSIWEALNAAFGGRSQELLLTSKGAQQILRGGRRGNTSGVTARNHLNHVHWAMSDGGVLGNLNINPLMFDEGGWLPPGPSLVMNATGKPEPLARMDVDAARGVGLQRPDEPTRLAQEDLDYLADRLAEGVLAGAGAVAAGTVTRAGKDRY